MKSTSADSQEKRYALMKEIKDELISFTKSPLYTYRSENHYVPVVGEGSHSAHIVFIGEAPGENEAKTGKPFCGAAGRILDKLLASQNMNRKDVYVTNIVKDRPPKNRDPKPEEIELYAPFLDRQIEIIQPRVITTLGRFSMEYIMNRYGLAESIGPISTVHGKKYIANMPFGTTHIVPLYHPAVALYRASMKATLIEDFKAVKELSNSL